MWYIDKAIVFVGGDNEIYDPYGADISGMVTPGLRRRSTKLFAGKE
jgi:hypothetical protein